MDAIRWLKQFNMMLADRGEMEDFSLLEPKDKVIEMRQQINRERHAHRRDVSTKRSRTDLFVLEGSDGAINDYALPREGKYAPDDYLRSKASVINLKTYTNPNSIIVPGDEVRISVPGHVYHNKTATVLGLSKGQYELEVELKSAKGRVKLYRNDFRTEGDLKNESGN